MKIIVADDRAALYDFPHGVLLAEFTLEKQSGTFLSIDQDPNPDVQNCILWDSFLNEALLDTQAKYRFYLNMLHNSNPGAQFTKNHVVINTGCSKAIAREIMNRAFAYGIIQQSGAAYKWAEKSRIILMNLFPNRKCLKKVYGITPGLKTVGEEIPEDSAMAHGEQTTREEIKDDIRMVIGGSEDQIEASAKRFEGDYDDSNTEPEQGPVGVIQKKSVKPKHRMKMVHGKGKKK